MLRPAGVPWVGPLHQPLEAGILQEAVQPVAQFLQVVVGIEPLRFCGSPLPHKGPQGCIGERQLIAEQPPLRGDALVPAPQNRQTGDAVGVLQFSGVAIGVLETIEMVFERTIVLIDQGRGIAGFPQPAGIRLIQSPLHHGQAFIDHRSIAQHQHRHGALGGHLQHLRRFPFQGDFAPLNTKSRLEQRPAGTHRVGAAAEAVEDRQHGIGVGPRGGLSDAESRLSCKEWRNGAQRSAGCLHRPCARSRFCRLC